MKTKTIVTILKYVASVGILTWLIYSRREQFSAFLEQEKNLWWMAAALVTMTLAFMLSYIRWQRLANAIHLDLSMSDAIRLGFIGAFFNVVAFGVAGGDSLRAYYAARLKKGRVPEAILSVFIDRAIGLMVMFCFAGIAWNINKFVGKAVGESKEQLAIASICNTAGILGGLAAVGLVAFLMFPGIRKLAPFRALTRIPKVGELIDRAMEAAALYSKNQGAIVTAICLSIATNMLFATTIWLVSLGVSSSSPSFIEHMVIAPIAMVANSIPLPGGVGGMEVALVTMYEKSYHASGGAIVAICYRLCILFVSLIGWIVWLVGRRGRIEIEDMDEASPAT